MVEGNGRSAQGRSVKDHHGDIPEETYIRIERGRRFRLVFKCCRCGYRYPISEGFVTNPKEWNQGWSEKYLEITSIRNIAHFPIECPKCGLRHLLIILPLPWEESLFKSMKTSEEPKLPGR